MTPGLIKASKPILEHLRPGDPGFSVAFRPDSFIFPPVLRFLHVFLLIGLLPWHASAATDKEAVILGQQVVSNFFSGKIDGIWLQMGPEMTNAFRNKSSLQKFASESLEQLGKIEITIHEGVEAKDKIQIFTSVSKFSRNSRPYQMEVAFDARNKIVGLKLEPGTVAKPQGRSMTSLFFAGKADELWVQFTPQLKQQMVKQETFRLFVKSTLADLGVEKTVLEENDVQGGGYELYRRVSTFTKTKGAVELQWAFDSKYRIAGFSIQPR